MRSNLDLFLERLPVDLEAVPTTAPRRGTPSDARTTAPAPRAARDRTRGRGGRDRR